MYWLIFSLHLKILILPKNGTLILAFVTSMPEQDGGCRTGVDVGIVSNMNPLHCFSFAPFSGYQWRSSSIVPVDSALCYSCFVLIAWKRKGRNMMSGAKQHKKVGHSVNFNQQFGKAYCHFTNINLLLLYWRILKPSILTELLCRTS